MRMLDPKEISFSVDEQGYVSLKCGDGEEHAHVECVALFPQSDPGRYVSVLKKKEKEYDEIGIIRSLDDLSPEQRSLVGDGVDFRYFVPVIQDIKKISSTQGLDEWDVVTDRGEKRFSVRDRKENLTITDRGTIFVTDIDKCRYRIVQTDSFNPKSRAELERMLL